MSSESSPIRETLEGYVAGRVKTERLVILVAAAYYGRDGTPGVRDGLGPLVEIIDRAAPGIVELGGAAEAGRGFDIRPAERSFPRQREPELRRAVQAYLASHRTTGVLPATRGETHTPGMLRRIVGAIRRLFSPSA